MMTFGINSFMSRPVLSGDHGRGKLILICSVVKKKYNQVEQGMG